jgi:hypothetical protein
MLSRFCASVVAVALSMAGASVHADNFLLKNNGLGAVGVASLGVYVGELAFRPPETWQGFPTGDGVAPFAGIAARADDCTVSRNASLVKALIAAPVQPAEPPPGVIRTERWSTKDGRPPAGPANQAYGIDAMYQPGQDVTCP